MSRYKTSNLSALPLAEAIDPDILRTRIETSHDTDATSQIFLACDMIDLGIAAQDKNEARKGLDLIELVLRTLPEARRHNEPFVQALSLLAFQETIFHRIEHTGEPFTDKVMEDTRRASMLVLQRVRKDKGFKPENARATLCELLSIGALARQHDPANFPVASTTREEKNEFRTENHDAYTIDWNQLGLGSQKWGMNVKAWNSSEGRSLRPHPTITRLNVLSILGDVVEQHNPAFKEYKRNLRRDQKKSHRLLCYAAKLLEKECQKESLSSADEDVLEAMTQGFQARMDETKALFLRG